MIKVIEEIPIPIKSRSRRDMVRNDIREALDKGIKLFEFAGDPTYKGLSQAAKDVADEFKWKKICEIQTKCREEMLTEDEKKIPGFYVHPKGVWEYKNIWIFISSVKDGEGRRVFCRIDDVKELEEAVKEDFGKALKKARDTHRIADGKWVWIR